MPLRYQESIRLNSSRSAHSKEISCLSFSPKGKYLASAGIDGRICIWLVSNGRLLHVITGKQAVLSLQWTLLKGDSLLCGLLDGTVAFITITFATISVTGFWANTYPVERLAIDTENNRFASGAHCQVRIWQHHSNDKWYQLAELEQPPRSSINMSEEVLVTGLHWTPDKRNLLVTYMHHGIVVVDTNSWTRIRSIPQRGKIGDASFSSDAKYVAVSNLLDGFEIYQMDSEEPYRAFTHEMGDLFPTPVRFVHGGNAILTGSTVGKPQLWDVDSGRTIHTLPLGRKEKALAIADHVTLHSEFSRNEFFIATASSNSRGRSTIVIWQAKDIYGNRSRPPRNMFPTTLWRRIPLVTFLLSGLLLWAYWSDTIGT